MIQSCCPIFGAGHVQGCCVGEFGASRANGAVAYGSAPAQLRDDEHSGPKFALRTPAPSYCVDWSAANHCIPVRCPFRYTHSRICISRWKQTNVDATKTIVWLSKTSACSDARGNSLQWALGGSVTVDKLFENCWFPAGAEGSTQIVFAP